jgi:DNA polymerase-3 subunit beta
MFLRRVFFPFFFPLLLPFLDYKNCWQHDDAIQGLKSIIPSNISHSILFNILIKADVDTQHLHLTAYNLEFVMQMNFDANVNQPGKLTLPAPILT